ncbi:MAG: proline racemase family protein, partial [Chloroflexota bacterium]
MTITTIDYHTGGEPFRIVTGGVPTLEGQTVLERRRWAADSVDHIRRLLVNEPRGHADMYGGFVTPPDDDGADLGVVFFHNEGYSTACGHGTIALVTWAIDSGLVAGPEVVVDVPSGRLSCLAIIGADGRVDAVRFTNVASFALALDVTVETSRGPLLLDIGFGGAFYGSLDVGKLGLRVEPA